VIWIVRISDTAQGDLDALDDVVCGRVLKAIDGFATRGVGNVISMRGQPGMYRQRVGDWRVLFTLERANGELVVHRVGHRREIYR
jgi:mRNA interferase RelE/StbE